MLRPTEPEPAAGRQQKKIITVAILVAVVVIGFAAGLIWWADLMPWAPR